MTHQNVHDMHYSMYCMVRTKHIIILEVREQHNKQDAIVVGQGENNHEKRTNPRTHTRTNDTNNIDIIKIRFYHKQLPTQLKVSRNLAGVLPFYHLSFRNGMLFTFETRLTQLKC